MIRAATPADAEGIAAIWNVIIRDTALTFTSIEKTPEAVRRIIEAQPVFVADATGRVAGFATYGPFRPGPGYAHTAEHSIHVASDARGAGLGRALMTRLQDHARADGIHSMLAGIAGENAAAISFHTRIGFATVARLPQVGCKFGRWHDLVLMQKFL